MKESRELAFAEELALEAGKIMRQHFRAGSISTTWKADSTPVTVADTAINHLVLSQIKKEFPGHSYVGEEGSNETASEYRWVCDPIDGTLPYSSGIPTSTFTLAFAHNGKVQAGVIYDPFCDRLYTGQLSHGSYLNGERLRMSAALDRPRVISNIEMWPGQILGDTQPMARFLHEFENTEQVPLSLCSAAYGLMLVASGELQLGVFSGSKPWDTAAASLIIDEAGGRTSDFSGRSLNYAGDIGGFIGAHPAVYDSAVAAVQKLSPEFAGKA